MSGNSETHPSIENRRRRAPHWLKHGWPYVVWAALCVTVYLLWAHGARFGGMKGVVATVAETVSPLETARLLEVYVVPGQLVKPGELIARLDTSLLDANLAFEEARMLEAETTITGYQQNILQLVRQFEAAVQEAETDLALEKFQKRRDEAELDELLKETKRLEDLLEKRLVDESALSALRPRMASLQVAAKTQSEVILQLEKRVQEAKAQREEATTWLRAGETGSIGEVIQQKKEARTGIFNAGKVQQELRKSLYTLRATREGVVSRIYAEPGNVIKAGDVLVRIVLSKPTQVEGFLPENFLAEIAIGQEFQVVRAVGRSPVFTARVASIAPEVMSLPGRISPINAQSLRGRRVLLDLDGETDLVPGETVKIRRPPLLRPSQ